MAGKWDERFMELALVVSKWSKDPREQVGAVLVGEDKRQVALGFNGFPPGIQDDSRLYSRTVKNRIVMHAERNVLDNAYFPARGGTLYTTKALCPGCAGSAISLGVARVVMPPLDTSSSWVEDAKRAMTLLREAGVEIREMEMGG